MFGLNALPCAPRCTHVWLIQETRAGSAALDPIYNRGDSWVCCLLSSYRSLFSQPVSLCALCSVLCTVARLRVLCIGVHIGLSLLLFSGVPSPVHQ
jgi:hypothetical protein